MILGLLSESRRWRLPSPTWPGRWPHLLRSPPYRPMPQHLRQWRLRLMRSPRPSWQRAPARIERPGITGPVLIGLARFDLTASGGNGDWLAEPQLQQEALSAGYGSRWLPRRYPVNHRPDLGSITAWVPPAAAGCHAAPASGTQATRSGTRQQQTALLPRGLAPPTGYPLAYLHILQSSKPGQTAENRCSDWAAELVQIVSRAAGQRSGHSLDGHGQGGWPQAAGVRSAPPPESSTMA